MKQDSLKPNETYIIPLGSRVGVGCNLRKVFVKKVLGSLGGPIQLVNERFDGFEKSPKCSGHIWLSTESFVNVEQVSIVSNKKVKASKHYESIRESM